MIEPTSRDRGRRVVWTRDGKTVVGRVSDFDGDKVYVKVAGELHMVQRGQLEWAGPDNDPLAIAARGVIEKAGFAIQAIDQHCWTVEGWCFWPALGAYRQPDGTLGYGGAGALVAAIQDARTPPHPEGSV